MLQKGRNGRRLQLFLLLGDEGVHSTGTNGWQLLQSAARQEASRGDAKNSHKKKNKKQKRVGTGIVLGGRNPPRDENQPEIRSYHERFQPPRRIKKQPEMRCERSSTGGGGGGNLGGNKSGGNGESKRGIAARFLLLSRSSPPRGSGWLVATGNKQTNTQKGRTRSNKVCN